MGGRRAGTQPRSTVGCRRSRKQQRPGCHWACVWDVGCGMWDVGAWGMQHGMCGCMHVTASPRVGRYRHTGTQAHSSARRDPNRHQTVLTARHVRCSAIAYCHYRRGRGSAMCAAIDSCTRLAGPRAPPSEGCRCWQRQCQCHPPTPSHPHAHTPTQPCAHSPTRPHSSHPIGHGNGASTRLLAARRRESPQADDSGRAHAPEATLKPP
jgi:hypothetical protein